MTNKKTRKLKKKRDELILKPGKMTIIYIIIHPNVTNT